MTKNTINKIDTFYKALGAPKEQFKTKMKNELLITSGTLQTFFGRSKSPGKPVIQEAVDALEVYRYLGFPDGYEKKKIFKSVYFEKYRKAAPEPSPKAVFLGKHMKKIEAHHNILFAKFSLLDYWIGVGNNSVQPQYHKAPASWATHEFLNFSSKQVRTILELMIRDAEKIVQQKIYDVSLEQWRGVKAERSMERTKTEMSDVIKAEATLNASVGVRGTVKMEYKGFALQGTAALEARANAHVKAERNLTPGKVELNASASLDVTIRTSANVNIDVLDILQMEAGIEGVVGALAEAGVEMVVTATGAKVNLSAEAFAGARLTGQGKGTLTLDGKEVAGAEGTFSAMAGVGASGSLNFKCGLFGNVAFGAKAGAAIGIGAEGGFTIKLDPHNMKSVAVMIVIEGLHRNGFKNKGKKWFLPLEENYAMATKCQKILGKMIHDLYNQNEHQIEQLEAWRRLERRVVISTLNKHRKLLGS